MSQDVKPPLVGLWLVLALISFASCSRSLFKGEYKSWLFVDQSAKILVLDYSDFITVEIEPEVFTYTQGSDLPFVHLYCINHEPDAISSDCIAQCGEQFNVPYVVVCRPSTLKGGQMIDRVTDYEARVHENGVVSPKPETAHTGTVIFDLYETASGDKIHTFDVTTRVSGFGVGDKRGEGSTNINLAPATTALVKARKKGLRNIADRIRN